MTNMKKTKGHTFMNIVIVDLNIFFASMKNMIISHIKGTKIIAP